MAAQDAGSSRTAIVAPATRRPLLVPAAAMAVGILAGRLTAAPPVLWTAMAAVALGILALTLRRGASRRSRTGTAAVMLAAATLGATWFSVRSEVGPRNVAHLAGNAPRLVTVEGFLTESPREAKRPDDNPLLIQDVRPDSYSKMLVSVAAVTLDGQRRPADGRLRVIVREPLRGANGTREPPRTGDKVKVTGLLRRPGAPRNPGQANTRRVYAIRGVHALLSTDHWAAVEQRPPPPWCPYGWMGALRARLRGLMPQGEAAAARIIPALFLGDRSELKDAEEQAFIRAGVMHYLAVSGLHVALLAGIVLAVLRLALVGPRVRGLVLIVVIVGYAMATELRPSVVRAGTFFLLLSAAWLLGRRRDMLNTLAGAAIVVLVLNPADLFNSGFQLSFLVALGLMAVVPRVHDRLFGRHDWTRYAEMSGPRRALWWCRRWLSEFLSTCLTAWAFAAPLAAWHYHLVAPVGLVATVVVFPFIAALMVLGILGAITALVAGAPAGFVAAAMEWVSGGLERLVGFFGQVPYGHVYVRRFDWPWVAAALALMLAWAFRDRLRLSRLRLAAALAVAVAGYVWLGVPRGPADQVRVTTLAIGSGNTVLVQAPGGYSLLVDCGSSLLAERTADHVTVPALWRLGVGRLDAVVLTHADADHIKDLPAVLDRIPADAVYVSRHFRVDDKTYDERAIDWLEGRGFRVRHLARGDTVPAPPGVEIRVLGPPRDLPAGAETNATSVVLHVAYRGRSMMLTGDATPGRLAAMTNDDREDLSADAVLLPHHGEESRELATFLERTGARVGVMSVGRYRDAQRRSVMRWPDRLRVYKTYRDGAVSVFLGPDGVRAETFLDKRD